MGKRGPLPGTPRPAGAAERVAHILMERYGPDYFSRLAARGGKCVLLRQSDPERAYEIKERAGRAGGNTTLARYGVEQYAQWGRMSAMMRKQPTNA